jgi:hypothetical protein
VLLPSEESGANAAAVNGLVADSGGLLTFLKFKKESFYA